VAWDKTNSSDHQVVSAGGIWSSSDGGSTWAVLGTPTRSVCKTAGEDTDNTPAAPPGSIYIGCFEDGGTASDRLIRPADETGDSHGHPLKKEGDLANCDPMKVKAECMKLATDATPSHTVYGLQHPTPTECAQCFTGPNITRAVSKGSSENCGREGFGGSYVNSVYFVGSLSDLVAAGYDPRKRRCESVPNDQCKWVSNDTSNETSCSVNPRFSGVQDVASSGDGTTLIARTRQGGFLSTDGGEPCGD
jgi:hypothetical protein